MVVTTYKGFDIDFDPSDAIFSVEGAERVKSSKSFAACKKWVDEFIKENVIFGEFEIIKFPNQRESYHEKRDKAIVKGISSLGNFLCEYEDGVKFQINLKYDYDIKKWCLPKDLEASAYNQEKVDRWKEEIKHFQDQIEEENKKLPKNIMDTLKDLKQEYKEIWNS